MGYFDFRNNIYDLYNHDSAERIAPLVYDTNLLKSVKWVSPEGRKIELDGQIFLNRSALMYTIYQRFFSLNDQDKYEYNGKPFAILMMDIENFASTNIYDEVNHTYGGDIVINQIVEQIKQTIKSFELDNKEALANVNITAARYGGDEFMFLVEGEVEDELILRFEAQLKAYISELSAFFMSPKLGIYQDKIKMKDNSLDIIKIPKDELERRVFFDYILQHNILNEFELKKVTKDIRQKNDMFLEEVNPNSYYPIEVNTLGEKLEHIKTRKNYLLEFIQRAVFIDKEANSNNCSQCITLFYESIINNPSYGYEILNKDPFIKDLLESQNNHIIIMDQKFLKEINWQFNMARGNKFLREGFWNFKTSIDFVKNAKMVVNKSQLDNWEIYGTKGGSKMVFGSSVDRYLQDIVAVIKEQNNSGGNSFVMDINKSIKIPLAILKLISHRYGKYLKRIG
ncbi:MAG: diguanylate cyclase [Thermales bacterium]|nr:diguanylate cyclase [Thermales bacterium]